MTEAVTSSGVPVIDYDALAQSYNDTLVTRLRGHTAGADFLELWVPDEDAVKGLLDLVDAAHQNGIDAFRVKISTTTLDEANTRKLASSLARGCKAAFVRNGADWIISFSGVAKSGIIETQTADAGAGKEKLIKADRRRPDYPVHAALKSGLAGIVVERQASPPIASAGSVLIEGRDPSCGRLVIKLDQASGLVLEAWHDEAATPDIAAIFTVLCQKILNRPLRDIAEHGVQLAVDAIRAGAGAPRSPLAGVLLVVNAGTAFVAVQSLVRRIVGDFEKGQNIQPGFNFFEVPPGETWVRLDAAGKMGAADDAVAAFLRDRNRGEDQIGVLRIEKDILGHDIRVIVAMDEVIPAVEKGIIARQLEAWLKAKLDTKIQLYFEPLKDRNSIRRL